MAGLASIQQKIIAFRNDREWAQFHDLKDLAEAFCGEAGEVLENFLGKTSGQPRYLSAEELAKIRHEIADIFFFLTYLCNEYKWVERSETQRRA